MSFDNGIGHVVITPSNPATGHVGSTTGGRVHHNPYSYMNRDWSIKLQPDNQSTIDHLTNATRADGPANHNIYNRSAFAVVDRENSSQTNECQINLKGHNAITNTDVSHSDGARTTMKQTTLYSHYGGIDAYISKMMSQSNYTTKDQTGGSKKVIVKTMAKDYIPGGTSVTGSKLTGDIGEVNFKNIDGDKLHTSGPGTYNQATPNPASIVGSKIVGDLGEVNFNPNRIKKEDKLRLDPSQISGLLNNAYSVYNKSLNPAEPVFNCDSRSSNYNHFKTQAIPTDNSRKNFNDFGHPEGEENTFLFRKTVLADAPTNKGRCYSGMLENSGYFNDSFMRETHKYINPHASH